MLKKILILNLLLIYFSLAHAASTQRIPQFTNDKVNVWQTTIYPHQQLKMHRHENSRVVVALDTGSLKITNDKGQSHILKLEKGHAYFLEKDQQGELHTDDNISNQPISVVVVELK